MGWPWVQHFVIVHWRKTNILELVERIGGGEIGLCCNSKSQDVDPNDVRASDVLNEETADGRCLRCASCYRKPLFNVRIHQLVLLL